MERPERPSRHKSLPVKFFRPSFSSDSDSELNEVETPPIQVTYYKSPEAGSDNGVGPSTSSSVQEANATNIDPPTTMKSSSLAMRMNLSPVGREEETRIEPPMDPHRRKRTAVAVAAAAAASASVIFDSVDSLISSSNTSGNLTANSPDRPVDLFQQSDYVIRPRSFCNIEYSNAIRNPYPKLKRTTAPLDLTPAASTEDPSCPTPVVTSSFTRPASPYYYSASAPTTRTSVPLFAPHRPDHQASGSAILRQFDEMCSSSPVIRRRPRPYNVRSPGERATSGETQTRPTTNVNRYDDDNFDYSTLTMADIFPMDYIGLQTEANRTENTETMEHSNDDVIVVETPERPPLPGSPDPDMVPSSRSPSPPPISASASPSTANKVDNCSRSSRSGDVPMTLKELNQSLVSLLECPVCLDHATPPIFQCCKGHILCQSCHPRLTTCPICRSRLPGDRNSAMEKVAEKLMYPCKNTVTGCSMMLKLDDKQEHEEGCGFRHYACILSSCHWKGYKPELVVHLQNSHPDKLISGASKEVLVSLSVPVGGSMFIAHQWLQSAHNEVFNVIFHVDLYKRLIKGCVIYVGSPERADKFKYVFELKQQVPPFRTMSYSRSTHADTLKPGQPLCLANDFTINIDMARLYQPPDCSAHIIPVHISIHQQE